MSSVAEVIKALRKGDTVLVGHRGYTSEGVVVSVGPKWVTVKRPGLIPTRFHRHGQFVGMAEHSYGVGAHIVTQDIEEEHQKAIEQVGRLKSLGYNAMALRSTIPAEALAELADFMEAWAERNGVTR